MAMGINRGRLLGNLRARLEAAETSSRAAEVEQPLAPFPPLPQLPQATADVWRDVETEDLGATEMAAEDGEYRPTDGAVALLFKDDAEADVYIGIDTDPANAPLLPMPTKVAPPPWGVVSSGTVGSQRPKVSTSIALRIVGSDKRCSWQVRWRGSSFNHQESSPGEPRCAHAGRKSLLCPVGGHSTLGPPSGGSLDGGAGRAAPDGRASSSETPPRGSRIGRGS